MIVRQVYLRIKIKPYRIFYSRQISNQSYQSPYHTHIQQRDSHFGRVACNIPDCEDKAAPGNFLILEGRNHYSCGASTGRFVKLNVLRVLVERSFDKQH